MQNPIPPACAAKADKVKQLQADIDELQRELRMDPHLNKQLILKQIARLTVQLGPAKADLEACIASNQAPPTPAECQYIERQIADLNKDLAEFQQLLKTDPDINKTMVQAAMAKLVTNIGVLQNELDECKKSPPPQPPRPTRPKMDTDNSPVTVRKEISWNIIRSKMDEFFNQRTDPPIFKIRFHHHPYVNANGDVSNDPPASDLTIYMLEAEVEEGRVVTNYKELMREDLGQQDYEYYFNDVNSRRISVNVNPSADAPLTIRIDFETVGPTEVPSTGHLYPDLDMEEFYLTLKLGIARTNPGGATGQVDVLPWVDQLKQLKDDDFDEALKKYVVAHIVSPRSIDIGGTLQQKLRSKIWDKLKNAGTRNAINSMVSRWLLGGKGGYPVLSLQKDAQKLVLEYQVPRRKLDPFPDSMFRPADWPYAGNPNPTRSFPLSRKLKAIDHIVVLTMENRSFDHMLGYLSLPTSMGGRGRTDVDGVTGGKPNTFNNISSGPFPYRVGDTAFPADPGHGFDPVFRQINANPQIPGSGKMDGFIKSFAIDALAGGGFAAQIMGYQPAANVPIYDVLATDFAISHRWFASHPGPTFSNRFYELTGRLNLSNGLGKAGDPSAVPEDAWEFSNSSPLTPVFNKTIFDHLDAYAEKYDPSLSWKYYEHGYCFLRFFSKYTFDDTHLVNIDDPERGFFADARAGRLPSVSFIDPRFIELPPNANADGPVADIKAGQELVRRVVQAVVASPQYQNTLLIITYDEHGGFYDHVPPPPAVPFSDELPIKTFGIRVPALFVSPRVNAGAVFGHDGHEQSPPLYFDHTSILKTIALRFMHKDMPYMGPRYAAASDLSEILRSSARKNLFPPFLGFHLEFPAANMRMNIEGGQPVPSPAVGRFNFNDSNDQLFSFEQQSRVYVYIRTHAGSMYLTVDLPDGQKNHEPAGGFRVKQDQLYERGLALQDSITYAVKLQKWKLVPLGSSGDEQNLYIISNALFPHKILVPLDFRQNASPLVLIDRPEQVTARDAWRVTGPILR